MKDMSEKLEKEPAISTEDINKALKNENERIGNVVKQIEEILERNDLAGAVFVSSQVSFLHFERVLTSWSAVEATPGGTVFNALRDGASKEEIESRFYSTIGLFQSIQKYGTTIAERYKGILTTISKSTADAIADEDKKK